MKPMKPPRAWALPGGKPAVVLGRGQHALDVTTVLPVRRRASGGGAVLTGPWLVRAAVRLPRDHVLLRDGPRAMAQWIGRIHLEWLQAQGVAGARMHEGPTQEHWACFAGWSAGEVLVDGRKLTGIAQTWQRFGVLVSAGTLIRPPPWHLLCDALARPASDVSELEHRTVSLGACLACAVDSAACSESLREALLRALAAT